MFKDYLHETSDFIMFLSCIHFFLFSVFDVKQKLSETFRFVDMRI